MHHRAPVLALAALAGAMLIAPAGASAQPGRAAPRPAAVPCCAKTPAAGAATAIPRPIAPCCAVVSVQRAQGVVVIRDSRTNQRVYVKLAAPGSVVALRLRPGSGVLRFQPIDSETGGTASGGFRVGGPVWFQPIDSDRITGVVVKIGGP